MPVAQLDEGGQSAGEGPRARFHRHQRAGGGVGVEPAQGRAGAGGGAGHQGARDRGGDGSIAGDLGRGGVACEQRLIGDHQVDRDGRRDGCGVAGDPLDQGVGHHLAAGALIDGGVGRAAQRGIHRDALGHRQQRGQVGHRVGCGADGDRALVFGPGRPLDHRVRIEPVGDGLGRGGHPRITHPVQVRGVGAQFGIQGAAVLHVEAGALAHDQGGPPLGERPAFQRGQGVRHLVHQRLGKPQVPAAAGGGIPAGQGDLAGHAPPAAGGGHAGGRLGGPPRRVQRGRRPGLTGRRGRLHPLQLCDALDQRRLAGRRIHRHQILRTYIR